MKIEIHFEAEYRELLARNGLTDFDAILQYRAGPATSLHRDRTTVLVTLSDRQTLRRFYLKRVYGVPFRHVLSDLLRCRRPDPAPVRESEAIAKLESFGIGVMRAAAWGQRRQWGLPRQGFLLVEEVPCRRTLLEAINDWTSSPSSTASRRERSTAAKELGEFVRRLHDARLSYPDLVAKHIFLRPSAEEDRSGYWRFYLIDVERLQEQAPAKSRERDLRALLGRVRSARISRTDLLRFAAGYTRSSGRPWPDCKRHIVERFGWARRAWFELGRSAKNRPLQPDDAPLPEQQDFLRIGRVVVNRRFASLLAENGLTTLRSVFRFDGGQCLDKPSLGDWRRRIRLTLRSAAGNQQVFYLKRYDRPPWQSQLERILTKRAARSAAWWEQHQAKQLLRAGIPTISVVAFGERMRGWIERRSFILTEAIAGESLERWVPRNWPDGHEHVRCRRALLEGLARMIAAFHDAGLAHRDLYLSHIFISHNRDGRPAFRLIDLQRVLRPGWRRRRWLVKDLAALNYSSPAGLISKTDRMRWLRTYLGVRRLGDGHKRLARQVLAKTQRIARHDLPKTGRERAGSYELGR